MKRIIIGLTMFFSTLFGLPAFALAQAPVFHGIPHWVAHEITPFVWRNSLNQDMVRARITNWASEAQNRLICVEAFHSVSGARTHLGCTTARLEASGALRSQEIDTPLSTLLPGTYRVVYTYQDPQGRWHQVTNLNDSLVRTTYTR